LTNGGEIIDQTIQPFIPICGMTRISGEQAVSLPAHRNPFLLRQQRQGVKDPGDEQAGALTLH